VVAEAVVGCGAVVEEAEEADAVTAAVEADVSYTQLCSVTGWVYAWQLLGDVERRFLVRLLLVWQAPQLE